MGVSVFRGSPFGMQKTSLFGGLFETNPDGCRNGVTAKIYDSYIMMTLTSQSSSHCVAVGCVEGPCLLQHEYSFELGALWWTSFLLGDLPLSNHV